MSKVWDALNNAKTLANEQAENVLTTVGGKVATDPDITGSVVKGLTTAVALMALVDDPRMHREILSQMAGLLLVTLAVDEEVRGTATIEIELERTREVNRKLVADAAPVGGEA